MRIPQRGFVPLCLATALAGLLWGFVELAEEVGQGGTRGFDTSLLLALRTAGDPTDPLGPVWLEEAMRDVTALGSVTVLTLIVATVVGYLLWTANRASALLVLVTVLSGSAAMHLLKRGFARPRPDLVPHLTEVMTPSFPSGHAMLAAVVYLTLGAMLAQAHERRRVGAYLIGVAMLVTVAVGISRVYLGVHWPSDVLAGWFAGGFWALGSWIAAEGIRRLRAPTPALAEQGSFETPGQPPGAAAQDAASQDAASMDQRPPETLNSVPVT